MVAFVNTVMSLHVPEVAANFFTIRANISSSNTLLHGVTEIHSEKDLMCVATNAVKDF
jgi:hypothetical protein